MASATTLRQHRGRQAYHAGLAAEAQVASDYERRGYPVAARRWRGAGGEIDLILHDGDGYVFVEVKKSRSFDQAMAHLGQRQIARLFAAAEEFVDTTPRGGLTDMRFDVALMNGHGDIQVIENALA
jgi:putative endonuclease